MLAVKLLFFMLGAALTIFGALLVLMGLVLVFEPGPSYPGLTFIGFILILTGPSIFAFGLFFAGWQRQRWDP